jgi:hypothetical protein
MGGTVARERKLRNALEFCSENLQERDSFENFAQMEIILKWILR